MKINHLIVGVPPGKGAASVDFYIKLFRYKKTEDFLDTGTGRKGAVLKHDQGPEILLIPMEEGLLPSPRHLAFEVSTYQFETILSRCEEFKIPTRSKAPLDWSESGATEFEQSGRDYAHFFVTDPSGLNLEIMAPLT